MSHHRVSTIPQKNTECVERDFSLPLKPFTWKWSCRYYLFYPCGRLTKCESSKVETVLIFCLVSSVSSPWCRSSWQNWPSGRESRQQAKAWTSWAPPSLPRRKRPTESGRRTTCWWETCFHFHTDHTATGVQQPEMTGKQSGFHSPLTLERLAYIAHWYSLVTLIPVFVFHCYEVWRSSFKPHFAPCSLSLIHPRLSGFDLPVRFNQ